ncbi:hypothetical protein PARPLA_01848 [Rhodobacteraceae bacterium THAF1]|uniref:hypothetical protein n=1 Tax=Palleronia sp. THAF1 TaxID=2587842 RepID=UPI000F3E5F4E|nr:hypothetical protein [Palleronia sp. THAF1]QFU09017.1 hypothetical protein FIU81_10060 [Palleronia sp. THAF1]VDC24235.1 hypothetical protein PARPLA_01848 [Rhodobacteraceae bacterium THAF1]
MSNNDSFIDEVSEEVRRDRLYGALRRYGWIAVALVLILVGAAAYVEYQRATARADAEAFGDAVVAALAEETPEARRAALNGIDTDGPRAALLAMLAADTLDTDEARGATAEVLEGVGSSAAPLYSELAMLKRAMILQSSADPQEIIDLLEPLTIPGAPYRLLALEQQAIARVRSGETDVAIDTLRSVLNDGAATQDLQGRVRQLIVALGGTFDLGNG